MASTYSSSLFILHSTLWLFLYCLNLSYSSSSCNLTSHDCGNPGSNYKITLVEYNEMAPLECRNYGTASPYEWSFKKLNTQNFGSIHENDVANGRFLTVNHVNETKQGVYRCEYNTAMVDICLRLIASPMISNFDADYLTVESGSNVTFNFSITYERNFGGTVISSCRPFFFQLLSSNSNGFIYRCNQALNCENSTKGPANVIFGVNRGDTYANFSIILPNVTISNIYTFYLSPNSLSSPSTQFVFNTSATSSVISITVTTSSPSSPIISLTPPASDPSSISVIETLSSISSMSASSIMPSLTTTPSTGDGMTIFTPSSSSSTTPMHSGSGEIIAVYLSVGGLAFIIVLAIFVIVTVIAMRYIYSYWTSNSDKQTISVVGNNYTADHGEGKSTVTGGDGTYSAIGDTPNGFELSEKNNSESIYV